MTGADGKPLLLLSRSGEGRVALLLSDHIWLWARGRGHADRADWWQRRNRRAEEHRLPMSSLARELTMTTGGFSKLADRMAADGLIDRRGTTDDRRVVHAALTPVGLQLARRAREVYVGALRRRLLAGVSAAELAAMAQALATLASAHADGDRDVAELVAGERDPALPDRRGRGRTSGLTSH